MLLKNSGSYGMDIVSRETVSTLTVSLITNKGMHSEPLVNLFFYFLDASVTSASVLQRKLYDLPRSKHRFYDCYSRNQQAHYEKFCTHIDNKL